MSCGSSSCTRTVVSYPYTLAIHLARGFLVHVSILSIPNRCSLLGDPAPGGLSCLRRVRMCSPPMLRFPGRTRLARSRELARGRTSEETAGDVVTCASSRRYKVDRSARSRR